MSKVENINQVKKVNKPWGYEGELLLSTEPIDIEKFKNNRYSNEDLKEIVKNLVSYKLVSGAVFHVKPGFVHRVISTNDLKMVETSTLHLDDVFRIFDESGRGHGKIDSEHK